MRLGISAYPLSRGLETGRGLERVIQAFTDCLDEKGVTYDFFDRGMIHHEWQALLKAPLFLKRLSRCRNEGYFAVYPVAAIFLLLVGKKPLVTAVHDLIPFLARGYDNAFKYAVKRFCIRWACRKSDVLIVGAPSLKSQIVRLFGVPEEKVFVVPYGVEHHNYYPDNAFPKIKNRIAFLGEAKRAKGMDSLIKAFRVVRRRLPEATLVLASAGRELEAMKRLAENTLPAGSYEFAGFVPENKMREFYNAADLFVFPSRYGFGLSALEAMACGTPALLGSCLDSTDFTDDPELLVDPENSEDIAQKILALLTDRTRHAEKSAQALAVSKQFSWKKMSERYYDICLTLLNSHSGT